MIMRWLSLVVAVFLTSCVASLHESYDIDDVTVRHLIDTPVYSQGNLGSCSAVTVAIAAEQQLVSRGEHPGPLSSMFLYWNSRNIMDDVAYTGTGVSLSIVLHALNLFGVPNESDWPYDTSLSRTRPSDAAFIAAFPRSNAWSHSEIASSESDVVHRLIDALQAGDSVVISIRMWRGIYTLSGSEIVEPPDDVMGTKKHAVLLVEWKRDTQSFTLRSSWGEEWADKGHFHVSTRFMKSNMLVKAWALRLL